MPSCTQSLKTHFLCQAHGRPTLRSLAQAWNKMLQRELEPTAHVKTDAATAFLASLEEPKLTTLAEAGKKPPIEILPPGMASLTAPPITIKKPAGAQVPTLTQPAKPLMLEAGAPTPTSGEQPPVPGEQPAAPADQPPATLAEAPAGSQSAAPASSQGVSQVSSPDATAASSLDAVLASSQNAPTESSPPATVANSLTAGHEGTELPTPAAEPTESAI